MNPSRPDPHLSRTPGTSLHRQLFTVLRDQIFRGVFRAGSVIPKEDELCSQFGVSRITVRRALADLEAQGLVLKRQGRGTFVSETLPPVRRVATVGYLEVLHRVADETQVEVLSLERQYAAADIGEYLSLAPEDQVMHVVRLRRKGKKPVMITEAWVPDRLLTKVDQQSLEEHALFELLLEQGVKFDRVVQEVTAIAATPEHARLLEAEVGQPMIKISRLIYDVDQQPIQYLVVVMTPERSRLLMDFSVSTMNTPASGSIFHDV